MPTYEVMPLEFQKNGPRIEMRLATSPDHIAILRAQGSPIPPMIRALGLIDTGSSHTFVQPGTREALGSPHMTGLSWVEAGHGDREQHINYGVALIFPDDYAMFIDVTEMPLDITNADFIIGRDVLARGTLLYSGRTGTARLRFPTSAFGR